MPKSRRPYPLEYRQRIVDLVRAGRSPASMAREFEPTEQCIRNSVRQADRDEGRRSDGLTTDERANCSASNGKTPRSVKSGRS
jgi:transposase